jgi:hypothetical protein
MQDKDTIGMWCFVHTLVIFRLRSSQ